MPSMLPRSILFRAVFITSTLGATLAASPRGPAPLVRAAVSDAATVVLARDRPSALDTAIDEGALDDRVLLAHIRLELTRPARERAAFDTLTHDQYVRGTAAYHRWLTPDRLRAYGPAQGDVAKVVAWLTSRRLIVNGVSPSGMSIDFGGSAGDVARAFHTPLHYALRAGEAHVSNIAAPAIPASLAPVITGVTLSDFFPKPAIRRRTPSFTVTGTPYFAVAPADFETIYNVKPLRGSDNLYGHPITGAA